MTQRTRDQLGGLLLLVLSVVLAVPAANADTPALPVLDISDLSHTVLHDPVEYLVVDEPLVPGEGSDPEALRHEAFVPLSARSASRGISGKTYWLRVRLDNPSDEPVTWLLHHETAYLDHVSVFLSDTPSEPEPQHGVSGAVERIDLSDRVAFSERPVPYRKLALRHQTPAGGHTDLYLRLGYKKADSVSLNFHLSREGKFLTTVQRENLTHGVYFGVMVLLLVLALIGAGIFREFVYVHYAVFLFFSALMWAMINGFAFQYLWPDSVYWQNEGFHIVYLLVSTTALQFSKGFLRTRELMPRIHLGLTALQLIFLGGIVLRLVGLYEPVLYLSFTALCLLGVLPVLGYHAWRCGLTYARWYAAAWLVYSAGLIMSVLSASSNLFTWGMQPLAWAQAGSMLEAMLLLVALGERLMGWERDRRSAMRMAHHDPLTGLGNRRLLNRAYNEVSARWVHNRQPVYLLLIDLDHFKHVNDYYGHEAGDVVLRTFASLLLRISRPDDVCIRYGGEEFAVLLQAQSDDAALDIGERIRREFAATEINYGTSRVQCTLSAGLVCAIADGDLLPLDEVLRRVDIALYRAKSEGRDRTIAFQPGMSEHTHRAP